MVGFKRNESKGYKRYPGEGGNWKYKDRRRADKVQNVPTFFSFPLWGFTGVDKTPPLITGRGRGK